LKKSSGSLSKLIEEHKSIKLDIGCGANKQKGFIGMDKRKLPGVDIVQDLEKFPYKDIPDDSCSTILGSHIIEHIKPWFTNSLFDELWRMMKVGGQLILSTPYAGSAGYWQDPTHCNGFNEATFQYYDPRFPLWNIYKPKPWHIEAGFPCWQANGNLEILLEKISLEDKDEILKQIERENSNASI
jgi:SAM-dependent methyltransferase